MEEASSAPRRVEAGQPLPVVQGHVVGPSSALPVAEAQAFVSATQRVLPVAEAAREIPSAVARPVESPGSLAGSPATNTMLVIQGAGAGPHQRPSGKIGLAIGAVSGMLVLGPLGCALGVVAGRQLWRHADKPSKTARMHSWDDMFRPYTGCPPEQGCTVKLWKAGETAPLTDMGYALVASDPRKPQMRIFVLRVVAFLGGAVQDQPTFTREVLGRCRGGKTRGRGYQTTLAPGCFATLRDLVAAIVLRPAEHGLALSQRTAGMVADLQRTLAPRALPAAN